MKTKTVQFTYKKGEPFSVLTENVLSVCVSGGSGDTIVFLKGFEVLESVSILETYGEALSIWKEALGDISHE